MDLALESAELMQFSPAELRLVFLPVVNYHCIPGSTLEGPCGANEKPSQEYSLS